MLDAHHRRALKYCLPKHYGRHPTRSIGKAGRCRRLFSRHNSQGGVSPGERGSAHDTLCPLQGHAPSGADARLHACIDTSRVVAQTGLHVGIALVLGMAQRPTLSPDSLPLLLTARARVIQDGWGRSDHDSRWSLVAAVTDGTLAGWRALELLRWLAFERNLIRWNDHPGRTGSEVVALIDRAIRELGGTPPRIRYREPRKRGGSPGGWSIGNPRTDSRGLSGLSSGRSHGAAAGARSSSATQPGQPMQPIVSRLVENERALFELVKSYRALLADLPINAEVSLIRLDLVHIIGDLNELLQRAQYHRTRAQTVRELNNEPGRLESAFVGNLGERS